MKTRLVTAGDLTTFINELVRVSNELGLTGQQIDCIKRHDLTRSYEDDVIRFEATLYIAESKQSAA